METYAGGTQVEVVIPLVDRGGKAIEASSVSYRVIDHTGLELVASVNSASFAAGDTSVAVTVSAGNNTLALGAVRELRSIELTCVVAGNSVPLSYAYMVESATPLVAGLNSFQTLEHAKLNAYDLFGLDGWLAATDDQRIVTLVEARARIGQLNLMNTSIGQDKLAGVVASIDILALTQAEFLSLSADFIKALQMAQVVEANDILSYQESSGQKRADGLMLDTIGEVKQMFRSSKPLELPVCKKALKYLGRYISYSVGVGRA